MIPVQQFVQNMTRQWFAYPQRDGHPRIVTPEVQKLWGDICGIFNSQLDHDGGPRPVIPTPLGSGKTTAMMVWSAMLPTPGHPGVLIVVRTTEAADRIASTINAWAGRTVAFAYHSKLPYAVLRDLMAHDLRDLAGWPVLVICHRGYEVSVDEFALSDTEAKFNAMHVWGAGRRGIVIVDEAMDLVFQADLRLPELKDTMDRIQNLQAHRIAWKLFMGFVDAKLDAPRRQRQVIDADQILKRIGVSQPDADAALLALWPDVRARIKDRRERGRVGDVISRVRRHLALHRWSDGDDVITGGRVILPPESGMVILDATATANAVYTTSPFYQIRTELEGVRRYDAVRANVIRVTGTGIKAMHEDVEEDGAQIIRPTLELVTKFYGDKVHERRVLVVTNVKSEETVRAIWSEAGFAELHVEHWNNLDGRNDFVSCDTIVTLTVPYARPSHDAAVYQALSGQELTSAELNDEPDEVKELREVRVAGQLAQAIGRLGPVRDLVRADGQAEPADLFLRLPLTPKMMRTDMVRERLRRVLPGLQTIELGEQRYRDQVAIYGELFTTLGVLERPGHVSPRNWIRLLNHDKLRAHQKAKGLEMVKVSGRMVVRRIGDESPILTPSEAAIVTFAAALSPGTESPLAACGLSEDARRRAVRRPSVVAALTAMNVVLDVRAPRAGGIVLVRR